MKTLILTLLAGILFQVVAPSQTLVVTAAPAALNSEITIPQLAQKIIEAPAKKFLLTTELKPSGFYDREVVFESEGVRYNVLVIKNAVNGGKSISFTWHKIGTAAIGRCIDSDGDGRVDFCRTLDARLYEQVVEGDGIKFVDHSGYHKRHGLEALTKVVAQATFNSRLEVIKEFILKD